MSSDGYDSDDYTGEAEQIDAEFDNIEPESVPNFGFGDVGAGRPSYGKNELDFFSYISASQYLPGILSYLNELKITSRYKSSLVLAVSSLFTPETALGNSYAQRGVFGQRDPMQVKNIDAKLILKKTILDASKDDRTVINPDSLTDAIYSVYVSYASRSVGSKRERLIVTNMGTTTTSVMETQTPEDQGTPVKKKSLWSFGRK